jgi:hypothetical protein
MEDIKDFDIEALRKTLNAESAEKAKAIATTNDWLVEWREKTLRKEQERLAASPEFQPVKTVSEALLKALAGWKDVQGRGIITADDYWQREVVPHLSLLQNGVEGETLRTMFQKADLGRGGWEQEYVARLPGTKGKDFKAMFDEFGLREVSDPAPPPKPPADTETGVVRQALNPPIDLCVVAPFEFVVAAKADTGLAANTSSVGGARNGGGFVSAQSLALVVMGGGSHAVTMIGSSFEIPADYKTFGCTATLDVSFVTQTMAILAGSTASLNAVMRVQLSDGTSFPLAQQLSAIPSPVICYREQSRTIANLELTIADVPLNGVAGPVRVFVGVEAFAAAAGIVGSSFGRTVANFLLRRVCISVR